MIVFEDEASFRQTPTLHATWARRGSQPQIPTRGERNTQKIFGAVRLDNASFMYLHQEDYLQYRRGHSSRRVELVIEFDLRIPSHGDQRSEVMAIAIPN